MPIGIELKGYFENWQNDRGGRGSGNAAGLSAAGQAVAGGHEKNVE